MLGRKPKIRVDLITEKGLKRKKYLLDGNRILIKKGKGVRGNPNTYASFDKDCIIPYEAGMFPFKRLKQKLMLKEGNSKCISFYGKNVSLGKPNIRDYFNAGAIKNAGATLQTVKVPVLLYLGIFGMIFLQFLVLLIVSGKVVIA